MLYLVRTVLIRMYNHYHESLEDVFTTDNIQKVS